ncbi:hypothetical protein CEB3_c18220 [Peptococcaceae bacterium CEB3]|nr:hypothetical protein CEB3_c18220 [Peptococcaceae bacterium CEB3]
MAKTQDTAALSIRQVKAFLDITDVTCPLTFVKAQAALEELEAGQVLEIRLSEGEPIQNVPHSLKDEGHKILEASLNKDGTFTLFVAKNGL